MSRLDDLLGGRFLGRFADGLFGRGTGFDEPVGRFELSLMAVLAVVLTIVGPLVGMVESFWLDILVRVFIFAMFALSLDIVFGYSGLLSFGHAAMFGTGGYVAALLLVHVTGNLVVVLLVSVLAGVIVAALIGFLSVRSTGVYFAMLTLAFGQVLYIFVFFDALTTLELVDNVTGGDNGLFGMVDYQLAGFEFGDTIVFYYLALALLALAVAFVVRLTNSPFGRAVQGIRENERRARFIGYNPERYKLLMFSISGALAALAGALYTPFIGIATPGLLHWSTSGEAILMVLIGGIGTLWGPMVGAAFFVILEEMLSGVSGWEMVVGAAMIVVVIYAPTGLAGVMSSFASDPRRATERLRERMQQRLERVFR